jgi:hypothetical protein
MYSVMANAKEETRLIGRSLGQAYPTVQEQETASPLAALDLAEVLKTQEAGKGDKSEQGHYAPGSINGVEYILKKVRDSVKLDASDPTNSAAFDKDMVDIQNVNAQISTLASALSSQAFASNSLILLNNFSTLVGVLDLANLIRNPRYCQGIPPALQPGKLGADDLKKLDLTNLGSLTLSQVRGLDASKLQGKAFQEQVRSIQAALKILASSSPSGDEPLCSVFEQQKIADFWSSYNEQAGYLIGEIAADSETAKDNLNCKSKGLTDTLEDPYVPDPDPKAQDRFALFTGCRMDELIEQLNLLRQRLKQIDTDTTELYDDMNEWYFRSSVEQTDLLPPLTSNAFMRISIVVQRGYTPFTLTSASGTITPIVTANVPASATAASSSTPAHAVKTILVEVHRMANFNLMGGVMFIRVPTASYAVQASPTNGVPVAGVSPPTYTGTCGGMTVPVPPPAMAGSPVTYSCIVQTQRSDWQIAGMAGILWFPWGHDYFPRRNGVLNYGRNLLPSLIVATSVTSLGNSMGGINWEPISGLDFFAGVGNAHETTLPSGLAVNTAVPQGTTLNLVTHDHAGLTVGLGFDLNVITALFSSKTSVAAMP